MRRRPHRHPYIETAVFAAALLLATFIARELWVRYEGNLAAKPQSPAEMKAAVLTPTRPPLPSRAAAPRTETAVTSVAPVKLSRVHRRKPKPNVVPAPR